MLTKLLMAVRANMIFTAVDDNDTAYPACLLTIPKAS